MNLVVGAGRIGLLHYKGSTECILHPILGNLGEKYMELKEFVAETIIQIIDGIKSAQKYGTESGTEVIPSDPIVMQESIKGFALSRTVRGAPYYVNLIEFDIAVTSHEGGEAKAGFGVFIADVGVGLKGKTDFTSSTANRIKFTIPVVIPRQGV